MKRNLFKLLNLFMACVVLLSSTGFGLVEHTCQMRGKQKTVVTAFSQAKAQPGCAVDQSGVDPQTTVIKKTECCQDDQRYENVDISSSISQVVAKFVKAIAETIVLGVVTLLSFLADWLFADKSSSVVAFPSPPSLSGRAILTLIQSLLI